MGTNSCKDGNWPFGKVHTKKEKQCNFDSSWLEQQQGYLQSFELSIFRTEEICSPIEQSSKKVYASTTTKSILLLELERGFCQQTGPECGQVQH